VEVAEWLRTRYAKAEKMILVCDNLNTPTQGAFYEAFRPAEARQSVRRLDFRHTPKHGSWLNVAENELSALTRPPLWDDRQIAEGNRRLAATHERQATRRRMAVSHRRRADKTKVTLSQVTCVTEYESKSHDFPSMFNGFGFGRTCNRRPTHHRQNTNYEFRYRLPISALKGCSRR
jgi:hypothetical protein